MITVRVFRRIIFTKAFTPGIVIMRNRFACPVVLTFYAEMIIRLNNEITGAGKSFMYALGQRYRSGNTRPLHFGNGHILVSIDVIQDDRLVLAPGNKSHE